jgi:signal transduction histidine kinase/PAS domain-containing protein
VTRLVAMPSSLSPPANARPGASAEAKLALVEFLLGCDDLGTCAQHSVEWLARYVGTKQAMCAALDADPNRLFGISSQGMSSARAVEFVLDLGDRKHALVDALHREQPTYFPRGPKQPRTPLGDVSFHALPLAARRTEGDQAVGLLLVSATSGQVNSETAWVADVLGEKLLRLRSGGVMAEKQFRRERALLYSVINAVTDPILLTDTEGKLIIANARAEKLFSAREDESEGRRRAVALNNMLFTAALASKTVEHPDHAKNELLLVDPLEGSDLLFEFLTSSVKEPDGQMGVASVLRNVTDLGRATQEIGESVRKLHAAQAEIRSERHRLDLIIDSVADPIVVTDAAGDIVILNAPAERLFTVPAGGGEEGQRRVRANDAHFSSFVSNLLFSGEDMRWKGEISLIDPITGAPMPVEAVSGKILTERGEISTVVTILHDRTEALEKARLYEQLKRASDELEAKVQAATAELADQNELLRRQAIELEQASAAKSQFLANMSHEFRTPLNAILGYTNMLLQGVSGDMNPPQKKSLTRIDSNARHLLEIINEILDITRIEAGRMPLNVSSFKLPELLREVIAELEPIIQRSKLPVSTELAEGLPVLVSDRQKVKQIVLNLLSNALKFTHQGMIRVATFQNEETREVIISVSDTGIGIEEKDQEKIFQDFQQVDQSPTRAYGGTGLGLSICRRLAQMLGGRITLQSMVGKGSTFSLYLPRRPKRP